jgi:hypothetical protein
MKKEKELEVSSYNFGPPFLPKKGQKIGPWHYYAVHF